MKLIDNLDEYLKSTEIQKKSTEREESGEFDFKVQKDDRISGPRPEET